jgi:hypothetical protein
MSQSNAQSNAQPTTPEATNSLAKPVSDDAKAKKAAYEKQLKERKATARAKVLQFVKDNEKDLGPLAADIRLLAGAGSGERKPAAVGVTRSINQDLRAAFLEKKTLSEMDIFKTFHIGRPEMVNKMRVFVLVPNAADRIWVAFDDKAEVYNLVGTGAEPPAGFTGYIPTAKVL